MKTLQLHEGMLQYEKPLRAYALSLTHDDDQARDLVQETTYRALKYRDKFKLGTNLKGWLYTIMRNIFINNYRSKRRRNTLFDTSDNNYLLDSGAKQLSMTSEGMVLHDEIRDMVRNLRSDYRDPFLMAYEGHRYDEIARHLGVPLGTVKSRIFLARKELQRQIKSLYGVSAASQLVG